MSAYKIAVGCDHAGFELKTKILEHFKELNFKDFGTHSLDSVDYPDYAHRVCEPVIKGEVDFGILICGSGNGINMAANKHAGIRSALCWNEEIAKLSRLHNDANVLTLPGRFIDHRLALKVVEVFLNTKFEGGRHNGRVEKINPIKNC